MAGPFKLRSGNSPLFKTMGSSPMRYEKEKVGPRVEKNVKKEFIEKEVSPYTPPPSVDIEQPKTEQQPKGLKTRRNIDRDSVKPPKKNIKKKGKTRKRGWFGMYDMGITEALDAMTKVRNKPKE